MRSRLWVVIDCSMLVALVALQAWRLTGVPMHEWLAVALLAGVLAHLLLHWPWGASRSKRILRPRAERARVNYALNLVLVIGITAAMPAGFAISKVATPLPLAPDHFLNWHDIND